MVCRYADVAANRKMELDAQMRVFSMTKVLASTVGLMLVDKGKPIKQRFFSSFAFLSKEF